jgi:phosphoribosylglycinamide formyltransferase-1
VPARLAILISGRGSNMQALVAAQRRGDIDADVALVLANRADSAGLAWARAESLPSICLPVPPGATRGEHEDRVLAALAAAGADLVCLAGYMRLLSARFLAAHPARVLNVHPSLLPAFPGTDAQRQALEHGVRITGATVHLVDEELDHGPILLQEAVAVEPEDTVESLSDRILAAEHRIYPRAVAAVAAGRVRIDGRRTRLLEARA